MINGLVIIMLVVGVHHVVTGLAVHRTGEVASVGANLKHQLVPFLDTRTSLAIEEEESEKN